MLVVLYGNPEGREATVRWIVQTVVDTQRIRVRMSARVHSSVLLIHPMLTTDLGRLSYPRLEELGRIHGGVSILILSGPEDADLRDYVEEEILRQMRLFYMPWRLLLVGRWEGCVSSSTLSACSEYDNEVRFVPALNSECVAWLLRPFPANAIQAGMRTGSS